MKPSGTKFSRIKIVPHSDLQAEKASGRIIKKEVNRKYFNILSLLTIWQQRLTIVAKWMHYKGRVKVVNNYTFTCSLLGDVTVYIFIVAPCIS